MLIDTCEGDELNSKFILCYAFLNHCSIFLRYAVKAKPPSAVAASLFAVPAQARNLTANCLHTSVRSGVHNCFTVISRVHLFGYTLSLADDDDDKEELYAEIFSDMCAYTNDQKRKLNFSQKALAIYEDLQKNGKEYSQNSYAMALHNAALIWAQQGGWKTALAHARKAYSIWSNLLLTTKDEQIKSYVTESQRLVAFLEKKTTESN